MFITGCHRSGTSLITSIFRDLINDANDKSKLVTPQLDNPPGFFESKRLVDFNEKLLQEIGATCSSPPITPPIWTKPPLIDILVNARKDFKDLAISSNWIDKDPRLCLLYPAYFHILLKRVPLIICMREPINVAVSLFARNGYSINLGLSMWFIYNHHISKFLTENDSFYFYEEFLNASGTDSVIDIYEQCCKTIEPITTQIPSFDKFKETIKKRVKVNLNRCSSLTSALNENICDLELLNICNDAYQKFHSSQKDLNIYQESFFSVPSSVLKNFYIEKKLTIPFSNSEIKNRAELNNLRNCYKDLQVELERNKESYKNLQVELERNKESYKDLEVELERNKDLEVELERNKEVLRIIKNTFSWKLTYPLRYLKIKLNSLFK
tara:strand:- start:56 stop:1201 length:1146 start_codon:yes stop_codon:yes gene_type:complete